MFLICSGKRNAWKSISNSIEMDRAEVSSTQAIADFRATLLVYISKVRPLLDDVSEEVVRTREWLTVTARVRWENQIRVRSRALEDAQQALFSAEISKLRAPSSAEVQAVHQAKRSLAEAEEKLRTVKRLASSFEKESLPRTKQIETLRGLVTNELGEGAAFLDRILEALDRYAATGTSNPERSASV
jgi:hypothetical protein